MLFAILALNKKKKGRMNGREDERVVDSA